MKKMALWGVLSALTLGIASVGLGGQPAEPRLSVSPPTVRLITQTQYVNTLRSIFGAGIVDRAQFAPIQRLDGLVAVGASSAAVTSGSLDQFDSAARAIAARVVDASRRDFLVPCRPTSNTAADDVCASTFISRSGRLLFRRGLKPAELAAYVGVARDSASASKDFYSGLGVALASLLVAPEFLFVTQPEEKVKGEVRLTAYAKASRISLLLWNAYPDDELLRAAEGGALNNKQGLQKQVDRMLTSQQLEEGVRNFFDDMLVFEDFDRLTKDGNFYPAFTNKVTVDAREQTLRTIVAHVVDEDADYRDLFTTRKTFLTSDLASIYGIAVRTNGGWTPYEFPEGSPRAGILTQASFLALHAHPARSSATLRGKALRELFLCQKVPSPPPNVDFSALEDPKSPFRTARDRVNFHLQNPACAGCHRITDPMGLALENFDGAAQYRTKENGIDIDATGQLDGVAFKDVHGLATALRNNPQVPVCLAKRLTSYALGRSLGKDDQDWLEYAGAKFSASGYRVKELLRTIVTSDAFYEVASPPASSISH